MLDFYMNLLDKSICYLIGGIDFANGQGKYWRKEIIDKCKQKDLNIFYLDPTNKLEGLKKEVDEEQATIKKMKQENDWEGISDFMHLVVRHDHRCVDISDFVIMHIDTSIHTCGSYFELQSALTQKKPYFIIVEGGKQNTPSWLFGICDHNKIYSSIDEVVDVLQKINSGEQPMDDRWVLIRNKLEKQYG
jgi:hypothetical protein